MGSIKRWKTPNFITVEAHIGHGTIAVATAHVRDAEADTLSNLCDQFRADVFAKAGKADPRLRQAGGGQ